MACRSTERGERAKASIALPAGNEAVIEVWPLDLCSFESVKAFCKRAQEELNRLDVLLLNAGIAMGEFELSEGYETTITTNVISTFFMGIKLLPLLRRTGIERNEESHLTFVASEAHYFVSFPSPEGKIRRMLIKRSRRHSRKGMRTRSLNLTNQRATTTGEIATGRQSC